MEMVSIRMGGTIVPWFGWFCMANTGRRDVFCSIPTYVTLKQWVLRERVRTYLPVKLLMESTLFVTLYKELVSEEPHFVGIKNTLKHGVQHIIVGHTRASVPTVFRVEWSHDVKYDVSWNQIQTDASQIQIWKWRDYYWCGMWWKTCVICLMLAIVCCSVTINPRFCGYGKWQQKAHLLQPNCCERWHCGWSWKRCLHWHPYTLGEGEFNYWHSFLFFWEWAKMAL